MTALAPISAVAFDLDGTLVDSAPDIAAALDAAMSGVNLRCFDLQTVRGWIGDGPDALIERALAAQGLAPAPAALRSGLRRAFDAHTLAAPLVHGAVFPGITELLGHLHGRVPMAVVTNKPSPLALAVLQAAGLSRFIDAVNGADTAELRKPAPGLLIAAAQRLGVACEQLLMVGDSAADLLAARHASCPFALVAWGYGNDSVPKDANPWCIDEPQQLIQVLTNGREPIAAA